jgi:apolipoprotein N-acyltransferase
MLKPLGKRIFKIALALTYAAASFAAMPGVDIGWLIVLAFLPLLLLVEITGSLRSFLVYAWLGELFKWVAVAIWLRHVSWFAVFAIAIPVATFQLIWFSACWKLFRNTRAIAGTIGVIITLALFWGALEILRTQPFGVPGGYLAVALWKYPLFLQVASYVSAYGVSCLIVGTNFIIYCALRKIIRGELRSAGSYVLIGTMCFLFVGTFGWWRLHVSSNSENAGRQIRIAFVQPNQPAFLKWDLEKMQQAVTTVFSLSVSTDSSTYDLMVWPEGTLPWPIAVDGAMTAEVGRLVSFMQKPLLLGNIFRDERGDTNSVMFFSKEGLLGKQVYSKMILVPFGEFVPFSRWLSFLDPIVPIPDSFVRGSYKSVLSIDIDDKIVNIGALVCYEDCFSLLATDRANAGSDMLYVATYNVWYGEEYGAYLHAAHSVLRAVETGRPVVRCGSGGWSGIVDELGRVQWIMKDDDGSIYFRGTAVGMVEIRHDPLNTFYSSHAKWILSGIVVSALGLVLASSSLFPLDRRTT